MSKKAYAWIEKSLSTIRSANWYRSVHSVEALPGSTIILDRQKLINFASNDYLGLAGDQRLIQAAIAATQELGTGTTGSRLLTGHRHLHQELELAISQLKQTENALVFSSGYLANIGTITALVGQRDLIIADEYNHSSLKNGAKMSGATVINYPHNKVNIIREILKKNYSNFRKKLIITDSVFSMDGDLCPLPELLDLAIEFNCMLLIDEAHATGVLGKTGAGCVEHFNCTGKPLIQVGTLSKALGSLGGYVAGSNSLIDFLKNRAPSWIYTTGLTPADTAAALTAIKIIQQQPQRIQQLQKNINDFKVLLQQHHLKPLQNHDIFSPIFCFSLPNAATAITVGDTLKAQGILTSAIRPPTVKTSRIRVSLMATHCPEQLQYLTGSLTCAFSDYSPPN
ncbi:MAG: 8-amino-7-oxononanoate synthase [Microcoleaceae cyanobacterium]